jgi:hypothetical protein
VNCSPPRAGFAARVAAVGLSLALGGCARPAAVRPAPSREPAAQAPVAAPSTRATDGAAPAEIIPRDWLVIAPLDVEGRRPFRADAVFAAHLLDRGSAPPVAGAALTGEKGVEQHWTAVTAAADGTIPVPEGGHIGWAFTSLDLPAPRVMLAQLSGAGSLWVNGDPFIGDAYALGLSAVPVALRAGRNALFVGGVRDGARLKLTTPEHALLLGAGDMTTPDILAGVLPSEPVELGVLVLNASLRAVPSLQLDAGRGTDARGAFGLPPLGMLKLPVTLLGAGEHLPASAFEPARDVPAPQTLPLPLELGGHPDEPARRESFTLPVHLPRDVSRHTYRSAVDDSVQEYAVRWPSAEAWSLDGKGGVIAPKPLSLLLTLHGAGVMPAGHAASYSAKPDFWIVAPSNRRASASTGRTGGGATRTTCWRARCRCPAWTARACSSPVTRWAGTARGISRPTIRTASSPSHRAPAGPASTAIPAGRPARSPISGTARTAPPPRSRSSRASRRCRRSSCTARRTTTCR